jgi:hypothetical protein
MRQDTKTGEWFTEGYCIDDGMYYAKTEETLREILLEYYEFSGDLDDAYDQGLYYYSEWEEQE